MVNEAWLEDQVRKIIDKINQEPLQVKIKYLNNNNKRLVKIKKGDWIDVYAEEDIIILQNERKLIPLGFCIQLPKGYEAHLLPRSSTIKNWGIIVANSMGIIDESYCGDTDQWMLSAFCIKPTTSLTDYEGEHPCTFIRKGDKIAQFKIVPKMPPVEFIEVDSLDNESRGGFGSTGTV